MGATSRVIMAAASVMVVVFASFVLNDQRTVNLFGFGLATAIAMYSLVAMLVLAPALLAILGRSAWRLSGLATRGLARQIMGPRWLTWNGPTEPASFRLSGLGWSRGDSNP